ncbi:MAG: hypothetical protein EOP48_05875 [Sphingobacteriales bacterium]|nr:MAG: hypothetical protein EOP48_05875 [Sphingobacteriales bacterium]
MNIQSDFLRNMEDTSLGYLLFNNGIYNFNTMTFTKGFNPAIMFHYRVEYDYEELTGEEIEYAADIKKRYLFDTLNDSADYFACGITEALSGAAVKKCYFGIGNADNGKTILVKMIRSVFGDYVAQFNGENLAQKPNENADTAALYRWVLLLRYKRIIISNEINSKFPLDGNRVKKVVAGGDSLVARTHCQEEIEFLPHFQPFLLVNDLPKIEPYDAAIDTRARYIPFRTTFVDENPDPSIRRLLKNLDAKKEILTPKFRKCMLHVFFDAYKNKAINFIDPPSVAECKRNWSPESTDPIVQLGDLCDVTDNADDFISTKDLDHFLKMLDVSANKFKSIVSDRQAVSQFTNIINKVKKIGGSSIRGWTGIRKRKNEKELERERLR